MQFILKKGDWDFIESALRSARFTKYSMEGGQGIVYRLDPNHSPAYTDNESKITVSFTSGAGDVRLDTDSRYIHRIYNYITMNGGIKLNTCHRIVSSIYGKQGYFSGKYDVSLDKPDDHTLIISGRRIDVVKAYDEIKKASYSQHLPKDPEFFPDEVLDEM